MRNRSLHTISLYAQCLLMLTTACGDRGDRGNVYEPEPRPARRIEVVYGNGQLAEKNDKVFYVVGALDDDGQPVPGVPIEWAVTSGGGSIVAEPPSLPGFGTYPNRSAVHTLGPSEGVNTVTASARTIVGTPRVTITAIAVAKLVWVVGGDPYAYEPPAFRPADIVVAPGQTVGWRWADVTLMHNVIFEDAPAAPVSSPTQDHGSHLRKFENRTTVRYRCTVHSTSFTDGMVGTVVVR